MNFTILGRLPSLNEYTKANRTNIYVGAKMKKDAQAQIKQGLQGVTRREVLTPCQVRFKWYEPNEKRDLDNVAFAKKFILDALVEEGILPNDSPKYVRGFQDLFFVDKVNPRIEVEIYV